MDKETAQACLRDCVDYKDKETNIAIVFTAEDYQAHNNLAVVNADFVLDGEERGSLIFQLDTEAESLDLPVVTLDADLNQQGFGGRALAHVTKTAKEAGVRFMLASAIDTEAAERTLAGAGWEKTVPELDQDHAMAVRM